MLPTIVLGTIKISAYWMMFAVGVISMGVLMVRRRKQYNLSLAKALVATVLITFFGVVGAKGLCAVQNWERVQVDGFSAVGFSFFGAVFLVPVGLGLFAPAFGIKSAMMLDAIAPCFVSIVAFMRVGCFLSGCCGGVEAELFGFRFHWPTQVIESVGDFFVLGLLLQMEEEGKYAGKRYAVCLGSYGLLRFWVEFLRDTEKRLLGLGDGQWFALFAVLLSIIVLLRKNQAKKQMEKMKFSWMLDGRRKD